MVAADSVWALGRTVGAEKKSAGGVTYRLVTSTVATPWLWISLASGAALAIGADVSVA